MGVLIHVVAACQLNVRPRVRQPVRKAVPDRVGSNRCVFVSPSQSPCLPIAYAGAASVPDAWRFAVARNVGPSTGQPERAGGTRPCFYPTPETPYRHTRRQRTLDTLLPPVPMSTPARRFPSSTSCSISGSAGSGVSVRGPPPGPGGGMMAAMGAPRAGGPAGAGQGERGVCKGDVVWRGHRGLRRMCAGR